MECSLCNQIKHPTKEVKTPCYSCDICKKPVCIECSELSSTELRCMLLQKRVLTFKCKKCKYEVIDILLNTVKDKEMIIEMLQEKIKTLERESKSLQEEKGNSYAAAVKLNAVSNITNTQKINVPKILVKPKNTQMSSKTKIDNNNINPADIKIRIQNLRETSKGTVIIRCQTQEDTITLKEKIHEKLHSNYEVNLTKMKRPEIKIVNFNQQMSKEDIEKSIQEQNQVNGVEVTFIKNNKNGYKTVFCVCSATAFKMIMSVGKLYIGWERYPVYENLSVLRCYRCQAFHHKLQQCKNDLVCANCSGNHEEKNCTNRIKKCVNCKFANDKYKLKYNIEHSAIDPECPSLKYQIQILKDKIDYING